MLGALDVDVGAALFAARDHRRLRGVRAQLEAELLDRCVGVAALFDLERVQTPDDDADVRAVLDLGDRRVAEDRALGDQLAALGTYGGDLHRHAGA